jgi:hypothetical protein
VQGWPENPLRGVLLLGGNELIRINTPSPSATPRFDLRLSFFDKTPTSGWADLASTNLAYTPDLSQTLSVEYHADGSILEWGQNYAWGGRELSVVANGTEFPQFLFSPDHTRAGFSQKHASDAGSLPYYSDLRGGDVLGVPLEKEGELLYDRLAFSPDSSRIAYGMRKDGAIDLKLVDVTAQVASKPVKVNGNGRITAFSWQPPPK